MITISQTELRCMLSLIQLFLFYHFTVLKRYIIRSDVLQLYCRAEVSHMRLHENKKCASYYHEKAGGI